MKCSDLYDKTIASIYQLSIHWCHHQLLLLKWHTCVFHSKRLLQSDKNTKMVEIFFSLLFLLLFKLLYCFCMDLLSCNKLQDCNRMHAWNMRWMWRLLLVVIILQRHLQSFGYNLLLHKLSNHFTFHTTITIKIDVPQLLFFNFIWLEIHEWLWEIMKQIILIQLVRKWQLNESLISNHIDFTYMLKEVTIPKCYRATIRIRLVVFKDFFSFCWTTRH